MAGLRILAAQIHFRCIGFFSRGVMYLTIDWGKEITLLFDGLVLK